MKITLLTAAIAAFVFTSCSSNSEVDLSNKKEVEKALLHEWKFTYTEQNGYRAPVKDEMKSVTKYNPDGTYTTKVENGIVEKKYKWSYDPSTRWMRVISNEGQTGKSRILKLTGEELITADYMYSNDQLTDSIITTYIRN
jgi:hypothetical protein